MAIDYTEQGRRALYFTAAVAPKWLQLEMWNLSHAGYLLAGIDPDPASPFKPNMDDGYVSHAISSRLTSPDEFGEWSSRAGMWRAPREWLERARRAGIPIPESIAFETEQSIAKLGADVRHKNNRSGKTEFLVWYSENRDSFQSKNAAAEAGTKLFAFEKATLRAWLKGA